MNTRADFTSDEHDGILFRFWIRAASYPGGWPSELMAALTYCKRPEEYRAALTALAKDKGINLPPRGESK